MGFFGRIDRGLGVGKEGYWILCIRIGSSVGFRVSCRGVRRRVIAIGILVGDFCLGDTRSLVGIGFVGRRCFILFGSL